MKIGETDRFHWHPWFAVWPIRVGNAVIWLEWVERRWDRDDLAGPLHGYRNQFRRAS